MVLHLAVAKGFSFDNAILTFGNNEIFDFSNTTILHYTNKVTDHLREIKAFNFTNVTITEYITPDAIEEIGFMKKTLNQE